jgi:inhibitor of KinA
MPAFAHGTAVFRPASDNSLLIYFDQQISLAAHQQVAKQLRLLELRPIIGIVNLHPAYCSVLVKFDVLKLHHDELETRLRSYLDRLDEASLLEPRHRKIPVCYSGECPADFVPSDVG